jgi:hypothetical protein
MDLITTMVVQGAPRDAIALGTEIAPPLEQRVRQFLQHRVEVPALVFTQGGMTHHTPERDLQLVRVSGAQCIVDERDEALAIGFIRHVDRSRLQLCTPSTECI